MFQNFLNNSKIEHYSRNSSLGAVFPERLDRIIRDLTKRPVSEKSDGNWIDIVPKTTK